MNRILWISILILFLFLSPAIGAQGQQQTPPPPPAVSEGDIIRPRQTDSPTGYIDNAIVGSQLRVRFDAGFGVDAPDRAEFFYGKCGCYRFAPPNQPSYDPNAPGPGGLNQVEDSLYFQELRADMEVALHERFSLMAEVPLRAIEPSVVPRAAGIGDIRLGFKFAAQASSSRYLTIQLRSYLPTGDARRGMGTNHFSLEPSLLYHQMVSEDFALSGQFGYWQPIGGSDGVPTTSTDKFPGPVLFYGFGGGYHVFTSSWLRVTPVVEFVGWRVLDGLETLPAGAIDAGGINIANVKIGTRLDSGGAGSFYIGFGRALTDSVWYEDILRTEYRIAF